MATRTGLTGLQQMGLTGLPRSGKKIKEYSTHTLTLATLQSNKLLSIHFNDKRFFPNQVCTLLNYLDSN